MHPVLINILGIPVFSYGFFMALGFLTATFSLYEIHKKNGWDTEAVFDFVFWILIASITGARLVYVALHFPYYLENPLEIIMLNHGGLVFYGGLGGGFLAAWWLIRAKGMPFYNTGDNLLAVLPIGQMFGRIGCFMNGCCFGSPTVGPIRVVFPLHSPVVDFYQELQPVHPVQLYECMGLGLLFLILISLNDRKKFPGQTMACYAMGYGILRFFTEFLRGDVPQLAMGWTLSQWISLGLVLSGLVFYRVRRSHS